jgi:hypothetical protein
VKNFSTEEAVALHGVVVPGENLNYRKVKPIYWPTLYTARVGKGKVYPIAQQVTQAQKWSRGIALLFFLTRVLYGVGGQRHTPAALLTGKTRYPLYRRLGEHQDRSGRVREVSPPPVFYPRTVQPEVSRYTDCAIPANMARSWR